MRRPLAAATAVLALACAAPAAHGAKDQESMFQDDPRLVYGDEATVRQTLDQLAALGVDRLRVTVFWKLVAPDAGSGRRPRGFDAADPASYPPGTWDRYQRIVDGAAARGMAVNLNLTAPAPLWATGTPPADRPDLDETWLPEPAEFGAFVRAVARRFPQVDSWSIYNEPNQGGWLTPQWIRDPRNARRWVEFAPHLYRTLVQVAWTALQETGQGGDTILVGETAPKGLLHNRGPTRAIDAQRFIKAMYCLDDDLQPFRGTSAEVRGCPGADAIQRFPAENPGLFAAAGFAHHPYELTFPPDRLSPHPDAWITTANLGDLTRLLRRIRQRYAQPSRTGVPLHLTEFGYQTNPPDRFGVTRAQQAAYLNHAEFLAWRNPDVRALSQFLLFDDGEPVARTFQSGLLDVAGRAKPALRAYELPIWLPRRRLRRGSRMRVWGLVRPGRRGVAERVAVQLRANGTRTWRTMRTVRATAARGYVWTTIRARRSGLVRLLWTSPAGDVRRSRAVRVSVARRR